MFSVLCTEVLCLMLKAGIILRLLLVDPGGSSRYLPSRLTPIVLASCARLCLQMARGSPDDIPVTSRPSSIGVYQAAGGRWLTSPAAPPPSADHSFRPPAPHGRPLRRFPDRHRESVRTRCQQTESPRARCRLEKLAFQTRRWAWFGLLMFPSSRAAK